jgi:hypothetical protein
MHETKTSRNPPFHLGTETNPVSLYHQAMDEVQTLSNPESHVNIHKYS